MEKELKLRKALWLMHGCRFGHLYGDDGEMQCNSCMIDFKRDSEDDIVNAIIKRNADGDAFEDVVTKSLHTVLNSVRILQDSAKSNIEKLDRIEEAIKKSE